MSWLWVALGGAIGASLRYGTGVFLIKPNSLFPWATWSINILGCLLAGIFFAYSQKFPILQNEARLFLMVVSYTLLRAHETREDLVCRLLLENKNLLF